MGVLPKFDTEALIFCIKNIITANFNNKVDEIITDKGKDAGAIFLDPPLKYLGSAGMAGAVQLPGDAPELAVDVLSTNRKNYEYDPYIWVQLLQEGAVAGKGDLAVKLGIFISIIDPKDGTGEVRILRYVRIIKEMFYPRLGAKVGILPLSAIEVMPCLARPDFVDATKRRLTWGYTLTFTW